MAGTAHASLLITLPDRTSIADRERFMEVMREQGACYAGSDLRHMLCSWEETNLWKLAALYVEVKAQVESEFYYLDIQMPEASEAVPGNDDTNLALLHVWQDAA